MSIQTSPQILSRTVSLACPVNDGSMNMILWKTLRYSEYQVGRASRPKLLLSMSSRRENEETKPDGREWGLCENLKSHLKEKERWSHWFNGFLEVNVNTWPHISGGSDLIVPRLAVTVRL